jgi:hypothetical protein
MKIYLDSKDVIDVFQTGHPCSASVFHSYLSEGGHELVLSSYTIFEIAAPLLHPSIHGNVMTLLNELEKLPILYVHPDVRGLELKQALHAFSSKGEYQPVIPFVKRFDQTLDLSADPATSQFMNYPLAGIVWDLYTTGALKGLETFAKPMKALISKDRNIGRPPSLGSHFAKIIERNLRDDGLSCSEVKSFANWIYKNPHRCPGIRLSYEVWHQIVKNRTDGLEDSDMEDHQHLICLPYVDRITLDRRMHGYVSQAAKKIGVDTGGMFRSIGEIWKQETE